jgi:hypothetical protein
MESVPQADTITTKIQKKLPRKQTVFVATQDLAGLTASTSADNNSSKQHQHQQQLSDATTA